ncbi:hypothetical protein ACLI1A_09990 [Flavobacterium sp. RHBU_3]|uniref:hypothetical protein n=1 Tax=Flavobacterium sp. RHBU_3 TaxID=3391184 RepID=UPI003984A56C
MKKIFLLLIVCFFYLNNSYSQDYKIKIQSKTSAYLIKGNTTLDTIDIRWYQKKRQFIKVLNNKVYVFRVVIPGVDNFEGAYSLIKEYTISNEKFLLTNSLTINKNTYPKKYITFRLLKKGIELSYKKSFFKRVKRMITFNEFQRLKELEMDCN